MGAIRRDDVNIAPTKGFVPRTKNKIVPGQTAKDDALHRDTTLLRRLLTQSGLMECRHTPALSRAHPSASNACRPSTRRLRSHVPPSVPRPLSPGRALFGGLKWGTLSFTATLIGEKFRGFYTALAFAITYYIILPARFCQYFLLGFRSGYAIMAKTMLGGTPMKLSLIHI